MEVTIIVLIFSFIYTVSPSYVSYSLPIEYVKYNIHAKEICTIFCLQWLKEILLYSEIFTNPVLWTSDIQQMTMNSDLNLLQIFF